MKKEALLCLLFLTLPITTLAKHCPTCFSTFKAQTIRGQSETLFNWASKIAKPKNSLKYAEIKLLFDKDVTITVNGNRVASGWAGTYRYLVHLRIKRPLQESKLTKILVDGRESILQFQTITSEKRKKYRTLAIAILEFRAHKLLSWTSVNHVSSLDGK